MGSRVENYCDGCGDSINEGTMIDAFQINAIGTNGLPIQVMLCTKAIMPEPEPQPTMENPSDPKKTKKIRVFKVTGCAKKVLTKSVLAKLYEEVAEYTGDPAEKPFEI